MAPVSVRMRADERDEATSVTNIPEILNTDRLGDARFAGQSSYRGLGRPVTAALPGHQPEPDRRMAAVAPLDETVTMPATMAMPATTAMPMPEVLEPPAPPVTPPPIPPPPVPPTMSLNDLEALAEPAFPPDGWLDDSPTGSLADHPLLRGLLLELPPKGSIPPPGWLDRWFEAARSILDLLYVQSSMPGTHR